jgi:hypothetical protein
MVVSEEPRGYPGGDFPQLRHEKRHQKCAAEIATSSMPERGRGFALRVKST